MSITSRWLRRAAGTGGVVLMLSICSAATASADQSSGLLRHYAEDTWASFAAMTDPRSGLPADSESRIVDYIGIAKGELPQKEYYGRWRSFPDTCDWSWQETRPIGVHRTYFGVDVFEGAYPYDGMLITPSWGGSMFEELMPSLFVPEERWAPRSWGVNHPLVVRAQIYHGMKEAGYGYWGFSPPARTSSALCGRLSGSRSSARGGAPDDPIHGRPRAR